MIPVKKCAVCSLQMLYIADVTSYRLSLEVIEYARIQTNLFVELKCLCLFSNFNTHPFWLCGIFFGPSPKVQYAYVLMLSISAFVDVT